MVELGGDGGNHHEKLRLKRILCASRCTFPNTAGPSPDSAGINTNLRSSKPNQASHTPDFSYLLISFISFSSSSPLSPFLVYNSTNIAEHKVESSLSISLCYDDELTPSTALHRVQHALSAAFTAKYPEYSIHLRLSVVPSLSWLRVDPWM